MPRVEELPYHGDNPTGARRFLLEGGDIAPEWAQSLVIRAALRERVDEAWCELSVAPDGTIGGYGGSVWPSAWPDLFTSISPSNYGTGGFKLTPLGFKLLGMHVTVMPCRTDPARAEPTAGILTGAMGHALLRGELPPPTAEQYAAEQYADLAKLAAGRRNHDLAADMYMLAAEHAADKAAIEGYLQAANVERTAARSTAAVQS